MSKYKDISGQKFNRLTALEFSHSEKGTTFWKFQCECGNIVTRRIGNVISGNTKSCGCYKTEVMSEYDRSTHGLFYTPFWNIFKGARGRCTVPTNTNYMNYGGRGIRFCWDTIEDFCADMMCTYYPNATLERIDVDGDYCKDNCKWETRAKQSRNRRKIRTNKSGVTGVHFCNQQQCWVADWKDMSSKGFSRSFSIKKYGNDVAFALACEARKAAIENLNAEGAGYSDKHGL